VSHIYDATYHEVLADRRVILSYSMRLGERQVSVSLTTIELARAAEGTHLTFTEQGPSSTVMPPGPPPGSRGLIGCWTTSAGH
jgi:hypothetical protein